MSERGALIVASACPSPGMALAIRFFLPAIASSCHAVIMEMNAEVKRVDQNGKAFAVQAIDARLRETPET
jgi:hypothetical protein